MNLKINFKLNKELDKDMIRVFMQIRAEKGGGVDFAEGIFHVHPDLRTLRDKPEDEQKSIISEYVDNFYKENEKELNDSVLEMNQKWNEDENKFINQVETIFKNPEPGEGKYIGYLSIINCNPRFLQNKTFQVFYKHNAGSNYVTAHEVLHFFFYDYSAKHFPEIFKDLNTNSGIYWDLAELFDVVVMSSPDFISPEYLNNTRPYPNHLKYFDAVKEIWDKNPDIDSWIVEAYDFLKSLTA
jgi:hypothetical protein